MCGLPGWTSGCKSPERHSRERASGFQEGESMQLPTAFFKRADKNLDKCVEGQETF